MRIALTILVLIVTAYASAQPFERVEVVNVDSTRPAADIYRTAERWFVDTFKDAQEVIQLRDSVSHTIVGKGVRPLNYSIGSGLSYAAGQMIQRYSVEVAAKPGRYRVRIYDVTIGTPPGSYHYENAYTGDTCCYMVCDTTPMPKSGMKRKTRENADTIRRQVCSGAHGTIEALIASLKATMVKPKEDW